MEPIERVVWAGKELACISRGSINRKSMTFLYRWVLLSILFCHEFLVQSINTTRIAEALTKKSSRLKSSQQRSPVLDR
jgi:preprotein translocase subunit SecY